MKVTGNPPLDTLETYLKATTTRGRVNPSVIPGTGTQVKQEDKVELSSRGREIQEAMQLLESVPDVREDKVALLKEQIGAGTYEVEGEKIAEKMLRESLLNELL
jgi:negative regulator of flagellin synthesis FlgM